MTALLDTSFFFALTVAQDVNRPKAEAAMRQLRETSVLAAPMLPEVFYLIADRVNYSAAIKLFTHLQSSKYQIESLTSIDMQRMGDIMIQYQDARFDYVDAAIMAMSERLDVRRIYTFDRRDFSIMRPRHCDYFELFP